MFGIQGHIEWEPFRKKAIIDAKIEALEKEDYHVVAEIALAYYDKTYTFGLNTRDKNSIFKLNTENLEITDIKKALKEMKASLF